MNVSPVTLRAVSAILDAKYVGDEAHMITGFNEIHRVRKGDCVFVDHPKYYDKALNSAASTIIIDREVACPPGKALIIHEAPFTAFNTLTRHFRPRAYSQERIAASARVGEGSIIMPGCYLGNEVSIGKNCVLHPNVVVYDGCVIGDNVVIHANTTIGSDAFYFKKRAEGFEALYTCGTVEIGDNVVIGSNCSIDKGVTDVTRIGKGTIIDNHVHVGHDVLIGSMCLFAAQVGIAGACTIGDRVTVWGQVGISSGITIGDNATLLAQSGVGEDVPAGKTYFGTPATEARGKMRELFALKQLPDLIKKLYGE